MSIDEFRRGNYKVSKAKYGNEKTQYKGQLYDSKAEAGYAKMLDNCRSAVIPRERVVEYRTQVEYPCTVGGRHICSYFADFVVRYADERVEVVDVKGVKTAVYKIKKKLVEAIHGIIITEV